MGVQEENGGEKRGRGRPKGSTDKEKDLRIAIARGMGMTIEETAEVVGCGTRKVNYTIKEPETMALMHFVQLCKEKLEIKENRVSKDAYHAGLEDLLADCRTLLKKALKTEDLSVALRAVKQIEDRIFGAPTQRTESKSLSAHVNVVQIPDYAIDAFLKTADEIKMITSGHSALPEVTEEAEIVD